MTPPDQTTESDDDQKGDLAKALTRLFKEWGAGKGGGLLPPPNRAKRRAAARNRPRQRPHDPRNEHWLRRARREREMDEAAAFAEAAETEQAR